MRVEHCFQGDVFCYWEEDYLRKFPDLFGGWRLPDHANAQAMAAAQTRPTAMPQ